MNLMRDLQNMLGQSVSGRSGSQTGNGLGNIGDLIFGGGSRQADQTSSGGLGGLGGLLGPSALGGLAGALLGGKGAAGPALGGALLAGGAAALFKMYAQRMQQKAPAGGKLSFAGQAPEAPARDRAERLVLAMVFAARCDGHIDDEEQRNAIARIEELNIGPEAQTLVNRALSEPLDPNRVAAGVTDPEEALQLFALSCSVIDVDQFMERNYLDALAKALSIPEDVKDDMLKQIKAG